VLLCTIFTEISNIMSGRDRMVVGFMTTYVNGWIHMSGEGGEYIFIAP
jgi:hypothetical protein